MTIQERLRELVEEANRRGIKIGADTPEDVGLEAFDPLSLLIAVGDVLGLSVDETLVDVTLN